MKCEEVRSGRLHIDTVHDNAVVADLETYGWDESWNATFEPLRSEGLRPGRAAVQHRGAYDVVSEEGEVRARVAPRLRRESSPADFPVVGDWLGLDADDVIQAVLPRRTAFVRRAAADTGSGTVREQVVAANVDVVLVVAALGQDLDPLVLERYVTLALQSGAQPAIVLTKADLEPDPASAADGLEGVGGAIPIHFVSSRSGVGVEKIRSLLGPGITGTLLGPSGVGKSTLVNRLAGDEALATGDVRADGSGRHTTTRRQLVLLPGGGLLIDNPGMREVHLWVADEGLEAAFDDIAELAASCRFSDCRHETEPGCAVQAALADGTLARDRWERYRALEAELDALAERLEAQEARNRKRREG
jgi:ribosome biogenesis GTPase / thiamine phosphate phosphatase